MEYNQEYFTKIMEEANGLGVNAEEEIKAQEEVLKHASKDSLKALMNSDSTNFYNNLVCAIGSARISQLYNERFQIQAEDLMNNLHAKMENSPKAVVWFVNTMKLVCAKLLGLLKFTLDFTLITGGFALRVTGRLLKASFGIIKEEGISAGKAIAKSFDKNVVK